jgi:hypothetical protein
MKNWFRDNSTSIIGLIAILAILVVIAFAPYYVTSVWFTKDLFNDCTGAKGDSIGGVAGPLVSALAAILVFIAFIEQVKANKLVQEQIRIESINREIETLDAYCDQLSKQLSDRIPAEGKFGSFITVDRYLDSYEVSTAAYKAKVFIKIKNDVKLLSKVNKMDVEARLELMKTERLGQLLGIALYRVGGKVPAATKKTLEDSFHAFKEV